MVEPAASGGGQRHGPRRRVGAVGPGRRLGRLGPRRGRPAVGDPRGRPGAALGGARPGRGRPDGDGPAPRPAARHAAAGRRSDRRSRALGRTPDCHGNHHHRHDAGPHLRGGSLYPDGGTGRERLRRGPGRHDRAGRGRRGAAHARLGRAGRDFGRPLGAQPAAARHGAVAAAAVPARPLALAARRRGGRGQRRLAGRAAGQPGMARGWRGRRPPGRRRRSGGIWS